MKCIRCGTKMQKREGKFGEFMFCPNQSNCKQKTVSVAALESISNEPSFDCYGDVSPIGVHDVMKKSIESSNELLVLEMRAMEAEAGPLSGIDWEEDFVNELGEPVNHSGELIGNEGAWFRPY